MVRAALLLAAALALPAAALAAAAAPPQSAATVLKAKVAPPSVASEPLFASIVKDAQALKAQTAAYEKGPSDADFTHMAGSQAFAGAVGQLSALDMQGHVTLTQRGVSDDLKCILKGMSQDLSVKLKAIQTASDAKARHAAFQDMYFLLRDNVAVITSPPQPSA
ncbi:MAG: hypothetical protein ACREEW_01775 [Caulobacteraceae bacterium]